MKIEIFKHKNLIWELVKQNLKKRYSQSFVGMLWYLFEPLIIFGVMIIVFTVIYPIKGIENFPIYLLIGLTILQLFDEGTSASLETIVTNAGLIKKIYFPREIFPTVSIIVALISIIFEFVVIFIFMIVMGVAFQVTLLFIPIILALELLLMLGVCLILSALYVKWRDLNIIWKLFLKILFWLVPLFYSAYSLPSNIVQIYMLNPITLLIEDSRAVILYGTLPNFIHLLYLLCVGVVLLLIGIWVFNRRKKSFAEEI